MIANRDFLVFSDNWRGLPTSAIHLFRELSTSHRVFWFNTIGRMPRLTWDDARTVWRTLKSWFFGQERSRGGDTTAVVPPVNVFDVVMIPHFKPLTRRLNRSLFAQSFRSVSKTYRLRDPIVLTTLPCACDFLQVIGDVPAVYYCVDDFRHYPGHNSEDWSRMEDQLLASVDGLIVSSRELAKKLRNECPVLYLPHGVDVQHFTRRTSRADSPTKRGPNAPPVVGFFGLIDEWVDVELILRLSQEFPQVSFVLLGKSRVNLAALTQRKNVRYLGHVPYRDLPAHASCFDVGLIPFKNTPLTRAVNPLKLLEYFALGLPVLSSALPELTGHPGPIWLARTHEEFARQLADLLQQDLDVLARAARRCAAEHTWQQRALRLAEFVDNLGRASSN